MALAHPPPLAGAGRGGGSPRPGRLSHAPPLACLVGRRDPPPWSSPTRGEETRRAGPRVNPKAARPSAHIARGDDTNPCALPAKRESDVQPHARLGASQGVKPALVRAVALILEDEQRLIEESLLRLRPAHAMVVDAPSLVACVPIEADNARPVDHACIL